MRRAAACVMDMSRRSYKTVNLPCEAVDWIDALLAKNKALGLASRDEFVRLAVAMLGLALSPGQGGPPLKLFMEMVEAVQAKTEAA